MQKLFLSSLLLIGVPFFLYIFATSSFTYTSAYEKSLVSYQKSINQTSSFIEYKAKSIKNIIDAIGADNVIDTLVDKDPAYYSRADSSDSTGNWSVDNGKIMNILYNKFTNQDINEVYLYMNNGLAALKETEQIKSLKNAKDTDWYNTLIGDSTYYKWFPSIYINDQTSSNTLSFVRKLANRFNVNQLTGILIADVPVSTFEDVLNQSLFTKSTLAVLINSNKQLIASSANEAMPDTIEISTIINNIKINNNKVILNEVKYNSVQYLMGFQTIQTTDWTLAVLMPKSEIITISTETRNQMLLNFMIILPLVILFSYIVARVNTKRIKSLISQMKIIERGDFDINILPSSQDEIGQLTKSFNSMATKTSLLLDEQYLLGKKNKTLELFALQEQIKPHFLYNTLDMINWMAIQSNVPEIAKLAKTLASFYKLSLSNGSDIVTIGNEINHVQAYVAIQNMRFENSIELRIDVPETMLNNAILKITLQPLVENSIMHGIREKENERGIITITGKMSEIVTLTIEDDGVGMSEDEIAKMFSVNTTQNSSGYGVKNINERIKLNFGNQYGLEFESVKGRGTKVIIKIPISI